MEMTVKEAAQRLGVSGQRVRDLIDDGTLVGRRVVLPGKSPLRPAILVDAESVERRQASVKEIGGARRIVDHAVRERMKKLGYMTVTEGAKKIGIPSNYLSRLIHSGKVKGAVRDIAYIHRDEVMRLRSERKAKIEAVL